VLTSLFLQTLEEGKGKFKIQIEKLQNAIQNPKFYGYSLAMHLNFRFLMVI